MPRYLWPVRDPCDDCYGNAYQTKNRKKRCNVQQQKPQDIFKPLLIPENVISHDNEEIVEPCKVTNENPRNDIQQGPWE